METVIVLSIGLFAGLLGGLLGIGGSLVMIPALTEFFGPNQHLYQSAAMVVNVFVAAPAVWQHRRAKAIDTQTVRRLLPLTVVAVVFGVLLSELGMFAGTGEAYLRGVFALFLFGVSGVEIARMIRRNRAPEHSQSKRSEPRTSVRADTRSDLTPSWHGRTETATARTDPRIDHSGNHDDSNGNTRNTGNRIIGWGRAAIVAAPTGLIAGLLGVGGGVLAVPLQRRVLGIPIRQAIANSAAVIVATAGIGAILKNYAYMTAPAVIQSTRPLVLALTLIPSAIIGSLIGSRMTHRLPVRAIRVAFLGLMLIAAIRLSKGALADIRNTGVATRTSCAEGSLTIATAAPVLRFAYTMDSPFSDINDEEPR